MGHTNNDKHRPIDLTVTLSRRALVFINCGTLNLEGKLANQVVDEAYYDCATLLHLCGKDLSIENYQGSKDFEIRIRFLTFVDLLYAAIAMPDYLSDIEEEGGGKQIADRVRRMLRSLRELATLYGDYYTFVPPEDSNTFWVRAIGEMRR